MSTAARLAAILFAALGSAHAVTTIDLDTEFSGGTDPAGTPPWLRAVLADQGGGVIRLTLSTPGLVGSEFVDDWMFNVADAHIGNLTFTPVSSIGTFAAPVISQGSNAFQADGGGKYDIEFHFDNAPPANRFGPGDSTVYDISSTAAGLSEASFNLLPGQGGGNTPLSLVTSAHIQSIGTQGGSGWITGEGGGGPQGVPDAGSTMALFGFAVATLGVVARKSTM